MSLFEPIFRALNESGCRYVVVGGVATVLHGHARLTADIDVVIDLSPEPARKAIEALQALGLAPRAPVAATDFADPLVRARWVREKGLEVFSMVDRNNPLRVVDLFVHHPIAFDDLWSRSELVDLSSTSVRIAAIDDLIRLKRLSGRPQDLEDITQLERIKLERVKNKQTE